MATNTELPVVQLQWGGSLFLSWGAVCNGLFDCSIFVYIAQRADCLLMTIILLPTVPLLLQQLLLLLLLQ